MDDMNRLYTLLRMIGLLGKPGGYPVKRLAALFNVSTRTIYRYLDMLRECGFELEKYQGQRYRFKKSGDVHQLLPLLNAAESALLREAVLAMPSSLPTRPELLKKLELLASPGRLAELIVDADAGRSIHLLMQAIEEQRSVVLRDYHSIHGGTVRDREVDPVGFSVNLRYLFAYDPEQERVMQFKPERIGGVELTENTFESDERYEIHKPDLFGMNGKPGCTITLRLNRRAAHLLLEEYPESRAFLSEEYVAKWSDLVERREIRLNVSGFEGVGRFVLGLPGEVEAAAPPEFLEYLKERRGRKKDISDRTHTNGK